MLNLSGLGIVINANGDTIYGNVLPPAGVCRTNVVQYVKVMLKDAPQNMGWLHMILEVVLPLVKAHVSASPDNWVLVVCQKGRNRCCTVFLSCIFLQYI
jgi:hypothetical protein